MTLLFSLNLRKVISKQNKIYLKSVQFSEQIFLFPSFRGVSNLWFDGVFLSEQENLKFFETSVPIFAVIFFVHISTPLNVTKKDFSCKPNEVFGRSQSGLIFTFSYSLEQLKSKNYQTFSFHFLNMFFILLQVLPLDSFYFCLGSLNSLSLHPNNFRLCQKV